MTERLSDEALTRVFRHEEDQRAGRATFAAASWHVYRRDTGEVLRCSDCQRLGPGCTHFMHQGARVEMAARVM